MSITQFTAAAIEGGTIIIFLNKSRRGRDRRGPTREKSRYYEDITLWGIRLHHKACMTANRPKYNVFSRFEVGLLYR